MGRPRSTTELQDSEIRRLSASGLSLREIADLVGTSKDTVSRVLNPDRREGQPETRCTVPSPEPKSSRPAVDGLRYGVNFTCDRSWDDVSYEARWHYITMVEECLRGQRWDGRLPLRIAVRTSDVPRPNQCLDELATIGHVRIEDGTAVITNISAHMHGGQGQRPRLTRIIPAKRSGGDDNAKVKALTQANATLKRELDEMHRKLENKIAAPAMAVYANGTGQ